MSKRKSEDGSSSAEAKRGKPESWSSGDVNAFLTSLGLPDAARKLANEEIDGSTLLNITSAELKEAGVSTLNERKKVESAIKDMEHPLMESFALADVDGSFKIDAEELGHVMTRVNGAPMLTSEVKSMLEEADLDGDGELDFNEFKEVMISNTKSENWKNAGKELGISAKFLAIGDAAMAPMHEMMRAGVPRSTSTPAGAPPRRIPSIVYRLMSFMFGFPLSLVCTVLSLSLFLWWAIFVLGSRGQLPHQWFFGTKFVNHKDGSNPGWAMTTLAPIVLGAIFGAIQFAIAAPITAVVGLALGPLAAVVPVLVNVCFVFILYVPSLFDSEGRTLNDMILGLVVVYDETLSKED